MPQDDWSPSAGFKVGDQIEHAFIRSRLDIWLERLTTWRWHVDRTEQRTLICASVVPGKHADHRQG